MSNEELFMQAFVYLTAAVVAVPLARRLGLGSVLGYLIAGIIIGPFGLGLIGDEGEDILHFAEFGVVMMLFVVGLELQPALLWRLRAPILGLGGLQVVLTALIVAVLSLAFGLPWRAALAVGLILPLSSTAIVLQTLNEKGLMRTDGGQSSFSVLLFQDIAVIPILAIFPLLVAQPEATSHALPELAQSLGLAEPLLGDAAGHGVGHAVHGEAASHAAEHGGGTSWVAGWPPWAQTLAVLGAVGAIVLAGRFLLGPAFRAIAATRLRELFTAAALLLVIGIALLMTRVGLSPALGTFLAGVVLANSEYRHELESDIEPFKGLLLGLFFLAVGASIDFGLVLAQPLLIAGLVVAIMLLKFAVLAGLARLFRLSLDQGLLFAFSLAQVGEFAFVLLASAGQLGVLSEAVSAPLVAVVALSMALTPVLMLVNERLVQPRFGTLSATPREADAIHEENPVIIAGFGRFGHIVGRLLTANGVGTTVLDINSDRVDLLRRLGLKVYYGDASRHDLLHAAGAAQARLLVLALGDLEKTLEMVHTARKHFPHLTIFARVANRADAYELLDAGVAHVYRETLDTSLRMGVDVLRMLGFRAYQAERAAQTFRRHDEASVRELAAMRQDHDTYINAARQWIVDMERILQADLEDRGLERDMGWDVESLREDVLQDRFGRPKE